MEHFEDSIHVDAPIEHVWSFYMDTSHWSDWMPRAHLSDFSGPLDEVGTTYVGSMKIMGHEMKSTYTVVEVVPQRLYHERSDWGPGDNYIRFEPEDGGTRLTMEADNAMPAHLRASSRTSSPRAGSSGRRARCSGTSRPSPRPPRPSTLDARQSVNLAEGRVRAPDSALAAVRDVRQGRSGRPGCRRTA